MLYRGSAFFVLLYVALLAYFGSQFEETGESRDPASISLLQLPTSAGAWTSEESLGLGLREQEILQLDTYVRRVYRRTDGVEVQVYVGYWKTQSGDYQAAKHSPKTCLPSNGWHVLELEERSSPHLNQSIASMVARFNSTYMLFDYWFFSGEEMYHHEWQALAKIISQKLFHGRSDGGIVELSTKMQGNSAQSRAEAQAVIDDFLETFQQYMQVQMTNETADIQ